MLSKCSRCGGTLYNRLSYVNCFNCGYEPYNISKDVEAEVFKSFGAKSIGGTRKNKEVSGY